MRGHREVDAETEEVAYENTLSRGSDAQAWVTMSVLPAGRDADTCGTDQ
jgi:hypothetical protein